MTQKLTMEQVEQIPAKLAGEADGGRRSGMLQDTYARLADLPDDERHDLMCRMVRAEFDLDDERLHNFVRARLESWARLDDETARTITAAYRHAIESVEAKLALRNAEFVQSTVGALPAKTQERLRTVAPVMFDDQATPQMSEGSSAAYGAAEHADIDTPVVDRDGVTMGRVSGVESKYFQVQPEHGDAFWLSGDVIDNATHDRLVVTFPAGAIDRYAERTLDPEDTETPPIDGREEAFVATREEEARRQYHVRTRDEREPEEHDEGPFDAPAKDADGQSQYWGWSKPA